MPPTLTVVIPTHNRRELLRACLESFERQAAPADEFEVVVVLDGSVDGTAEMVSELATSFSLTAVSQPQRGASAARNAGAARARGRILLFVDDDMVASPQLVAAHLAAHRARDQIAAIGVIERRIPADADRFAQLRAETSRAHYRHLLVRPLTYVDCYGGNLSVSRATFEQVSGFSVDLPVLNDFEFAYRLHGAGAEFVFVPDALVAEERRDDWREIVADRELRGRTAVELCRRDPALVRQTELGANETLHGFWLGLRALLLALRVPPRALARLGLLVPRRSWAQRWFGFVFSYAYWRGVARVSSYGERKRLRRETLLPRS